MKKLFYLAIAIATITSCKKDDGGSNNGGGTTAGPQITGATFVGSMGANSKRSGYRVDSGLVKFPVAGTAVLYKYDSLSDAKKWDDSLKTPNRPTDYANATYMQGITVDLLGMNVSFNQFYSASTNSWQNLGSYLDAPINTTISGYSIAIAAQAVKNNPVQNLVKFPIAYLDSFNENSSGSLTSNVGGTYLGAQFNTPLTITRSYKINSKNIAYGSMKLKGYTSDLEVVVQRYMVETTTSFTTGSSFLDAALNSALSGYGINNGQKTYTTEYRYWAKDKGLVMSMGDNGVAYVRTGL